MQQSKRKAKDVAFLEKVNALAIEHGVVGFFMAACDEDGGVACYEVTPDKEHGCGHCKACKIADDVEEIVKGISGLVRNAIGEPKAEQKGRIDAAGQVSTNPSDKPKPTLH